MNTKPNAPRGLMDEDGREPEALAPPSDEPSSDVTSEQLTRVGPAMLVIVLAVLTTYLIPGLEFAQPLRQDDPIPFWNVLGRSDHDEAQRIAASEEHTAAVDELMHEAEREADEVVEDDPLVIHDADPEKNLPAYEHHRDDDAHVEQSLELFSGRELELFFIALARTEARYEGATTRVMHWGDSVIGLDGVTGAIRKRMQGRFGDAGHGFHAITPPNTSYRHKGVKFRHNKRWSLCFIIRNCQKDGHYGIAGTIAESSGGAESSIRPDPRHSSGQVSRFNVYYVAQPDGGPLQLQVDDDQAVVLDTQADVLEDRFHEIEVEDGDHELTIRALNTPGRKTSVRVHGVTLERDEPGVVWDGLALLGAFSKRLLLLDDAHLRTQLEHRQSNLVVLMFGGNDMVRKISTEKYIEEYGSVVAQVKRAKPDISCAIMSPLDHGLRRGKRVTSRPIVQVMVDAQREVARQQGCAFFDTFSAMGGDGSAGRWYEKKPRLISGDLSHLTNKGQIVIGEMFYRALMQAYVAYRTGGAQRPQSQQ